ncbi:MAG: response regulator, partial [Planctomycetes bacterium]|nr:response regulator [Planctomycetota bacterium]
MFPEEDDECFDEHLAKLKNAVIMMVDDEPINTDVIQIHLETAGYRNFLITDQSSQAMGLLKNENPDVLLLDLKMPDVTGFDILADMRREQLLKHIPVIVLTSSSSAETKLKVLELGASDFLSKPVDSSELILRLQNTLTAKAYQDQLAFYDSLTGRPNRRAFIQRTNSAVTNASQEGRSITVLHIGLDRFKQINDTFGP